MKFKSKSLISIILSIMMVISMILVAIPANAAVVDSEPVGADTTSYYLWYNTSSAEDPTTYKGGPVKMNLENGKLVGYFTSTANQNVYFIINNSSATSASTSVWSSNPTIKHTDDFNWSQGVYGWYGTQNYGYVKAEIKNKPATRVKVVVDTTSSYSVELSLDSSSPDTYAVNFGYGGTGSGTVTAQAGSTTLASGSKVNNNTSVTFTAEADANNTFDGWYSTQDCSGTAVSTDNPYTKTVTAITNVYAKFTSTATPTTKYYLGGRIKQDGKSDEWLKTDNIDYPFVATETAGLYKYVSKQTPADWSKTVTNLQYFYVHTGSGNPWYGSQPDTDNDAAVLTSAGQTITLKEYSKDTGTDVTRLTYIKNTDTTGNVIFYLDTNDGMKLYYEVEGGSTTKGAFEIKDKTAVNGSLTFSSDGKTAGTADAGDTVNVTAKPYAGFTCSGITVSYTNKTTSKTVTLDSTGSGNSYGFVVPSDLTTTDVKNKEISVAATFTLDKAAYIATQGNGLWIDVAPNENDSTATLIKWNNYSGNNQNTNTNPYTFYVPKNVDLANATVYNGFDSEVKLNGVSIPANSCNTAPLSITPSETNYTTSGGTTSPVKVMQGSTNAMFLYTTKGDAAYSLPTKTGAGGTKDSVESDGGSCKTMTDTTDTAKQFSAAMALDSVKGRGNSSWEASNKLFGKYAFNMKLAKKTNLFNIDTTKLPDGSKPSGSKSWCLLANNADESMLRNALTYQLASEIGLLYSPEFSFVDIYDNGEYLGSYLVTEKVDVGNSKLVKGESFDDINEEAANKNVDEGTNRGTYTYNDTQYNMQYVNVLPSGSNTSTIDYDKKGKYLLEFEIKKRLFPSDGNENNTASEASWFRSPRGQYVVVKSPEFATKKQVEFIAGKFAEMEAKVFTANAAKSDLSTVMDVESFAKMYLIQEFSSNLDSAATSYYMTFDCAQTNPVFVANPVWDYDWAYGQYEKDAKNSVTNSGVSSPLDTDNPQAWYAKTKQMGDNQIDDYSIQSQLANNNSAFKSEVRKAWEGTDGFYATIQKYFGDNSQIDTWYTQIKDSVNMNETRWGFIANDPLKNGATGNGSDGWGSNNTGDNHLAAVNYLKTDWTSTRATWLNEQFTSTTQTEYTTYTPDAPTIKLYAADGKTETSAVEQGKGFIIKVTSPVENNVVYRFFTSDGTQVGADQSDGILEIATDDLTVGETYTYKVQAVYNGNASGDSNTVSIKIDDKAGNKQVTIYFKSASASAYVPSLSIDGATAAVMTREAKTANSNGTYFGSTYSGSLKFYWFFTKIKLDTSVEHTLKFTTKDNRVNASTSYEFVASEGNNYYFAVDNLMGDTNLVDLTEYKEYIRNYHISATHMVYSEISDNNIGFTWIDGTEYAMGTYLKDNNIDTASLSDLTSSSLLTIPSALTPNAMLEASSAPAFFTIKSATLAQRISAEAEEVSTLQYQLLDVNLDGKVDVKDSTMMQKALAGF